jgi:hypothetical protein
MQAGVGGEANFMLLDNNSTKSYEVARDLLAAITQNDKNRIRVLLLAGATRKQLSKAVSTVLRVPFRVILSSAGFRVQKSYLIAVFGLRF